MTSTAARRALTAPEILAAEETTPHFVIVSFGYRHGIPPRADVTLDLRRRLRNPADDKALRQMTGHDAAVRRHVLAATRGSMRLVLNAARLLAALRADTAAQPEPVVAAYGCAGGRHRSVVLAESTARRLRVLGYRVEVEHRDVHRPVITG
ncbi:RapZ C-terminal domain-containing protein [Microbispora sp. CA-102843]|uniref:RapZ C-terminal domain-containing protein n=1 Tax=Microbispora sp. CA-102843 TaxID=3239952 RepID=UPI003D8A016D